MCCYALVETHLNVSFSVLPSLLHQWWISSRTSNTHEFCYASGNLYSLEGFFIFWKIWFFHLLSQKMSQNGPKCKKIALQGITSQQYVQWSWYLVHKFLKSFDYSTRYRHKKVKKGPKWHQQKIITRNWWRLKRLRADPSPVSEPRISQGHVIKRSCDMGKSPSRKAIIMSSLVAIDTLVIEIWWVFFATWPCKTTWSKPCMTLWLGACQGISPS